LAATERRNTEKNGGLFFDLLTGKVVKAVATTAKSVVIVTYFLEMRRWRHWVKICMLKK
jgi:hypothetical protein